MDEAQTGHVFTTRFKMAFTATVRVVAQSSRPVRVWLDERELLVLPGGYEVPASPIKSNRKD